MRDDNYRNQRPNEQHRRPAASAGHGQGGDPLAELARLIGQNDPFSDFARDQGRAAAPSHDPRYAEPGPSEWQAQPAPFRDAPQARPAAQSQYEQGGHRDVPGDLRGYDHFRDDPATDGRYAQQDYAQQDYARPGAAMPGQDYDPQQYEDPRYAAYGNDQHGYPPQHAFARPHAPQGHGSDPYYRGMPHDEDMYEDHAPARRRGGMLTVMAVLALAVVGTAAAFGYRALFSGSGAALTPPTIKADAGPNKVVPAVQSGDASGKLIYDRVGDKGQQERVVSREEQPVDLKSAAPPPRVVLSSGMQNPIAPIPNSPVPPSAPAFAAPSAQGAPPAASTTANASTEPKKVRTVTIRPDQPAGAAETVSTRSAPARSAGADEPAPVTTTVRTTTVRSQQAQGNPNAPLSLTPQRSGTMRTASAPATQPVATASGSAYAVQVTSQRTEAEAQSSYQALQAKYPSVLGNRQATIRRADLGDKGTYYRAQVPFGSQSEASEFCASLKAAGGQCVVQRN